MADRREKRMAVPSTDSMEAKKPKHVPRLRGSGSSSSATPLSEHEEIEGIPLPSPSSQSLSLPPPAEPPVQGWPRTQGELPPQGEPPVLSSSPSTTMYPPIPSAYFLGMMLDEHVPLRQLMEDVKHEVCQARSDIQHLRDNLLDMRHHFAAFRTSIIDELRRLPHPLPSTSAPVSSIASLPTAAVFSDDAGPSQRLHAPLSSDAEIRLPPLPSSAMPSSLSLPLSGPPGYSDSTIIFSQPIPLYSPGTDIPLCPEILLPEPPPPPARLPSPPHPHSSPSSDSSPAPSPPYTPLPFTFADDLPVVCRPGYTQFYLDCHPSPLVHERLHDPTIFSEFSFLFSLPSSALRITQLLHALTIMEEEGGLASVDSTRLRRFVQHFSLDGHPCRVLSCRRLLSTPLPSSSISSTLDPSYFSAFSPTTVSPTSPPADPGPSSTTACSVSSTIPLSTQPGPSSPL